MSKKILAVVVLIVVVGLALFVGIKIGEKQKEKWYSKYLTVVEGRAHQKAIDEVASMVRQYPEILTEDGRTIGTRFEYENNPYDYKILWIKNNDGRLIIGRSDSWSDIPQ